MAVLQAKEEPVAPVRSALGREPTGAGELAMLRRR